MEYAVKRAQERFHLELPAAVGLRGASEAARSCRAVTRDISSSGAFLRTPVACAEGTELEIDLTLVAGGKRHPETSAVNVRLRATVVRLVPEGIAVRFRKTCRITPA